MDSPPDSPPHAFKLWDAFPPSQVAFLVSVTVALYAAAFSSRPRLSVANLLPRPGDDISGFRTLPDVVKPTQEAQGALDDERQVEAEEEKESLLAKDDGEAQVARPPLSRLKMAGFIALSVGLAVADGCLVYAVSDGWLQAFLCIVFAVIFTFPFGMVLWKVFSRHLETLAKKADGSVISGTVRDPTGLSYGWMGLFLLVGFAVVPSLALDRRPLYFMLPFALGELAVEKLGQRVRFRWLLLTHIATLAGAFILVGVFGTVAFFSSDDDAQPKPSPTPAGDDDVWDSLMQTRVFVVWALELAPLINAGPAAFNIIAMLYRFDRRPSAAELRTASSGPEAAVIMPAAFSAAGEGRRMVIATVPTIFKLKLQFWREGGRPTLTYSNAAIATLVLALAAAPVLPVYLFHDELAPTIIVAAARTAVFFLAPFLLAPAVFALAHARGEAGLLWGYEEDWGVPTPTEAVGEVGAGARVEAGEEAEVDKLLE